MIRVVTPPAAVPEALVLSSTVTLLKASSAQQSRVQELIQDASRLAEQIACRSLWFRGYEQTVEGGDDRLYLSVRPISQVTAVRATLGGEAVSPSLYDLWPEDGAISRQGGAWTRGSWLVAYEGGYWLPSMTGPRPETAADVAITGRHIRKAVEDIVVASWSVDKMDRGVRAESMGGKASISTTYNTDLYIPDGALAVLRRLAPIVP